MSDHSAGDGLPGVQAALLGRVPFEESWELQQKIWEDRAGGKTGEDIFLFLEHDPVFTLGTGGSEANVLSRRPPSGEGEIPLVRINRGGEVTYHGPGQLMMYAICDLRRRERDVHIHCRRLEEVFVRYLSAMGITAERRADMPGLWIEGRKILSLGVGARRWVTTHGVAFNIAPDLRFFDMIHPCGEVGARVTSLEKLIGEAPPLGEVAESLSPVCRDVFGQEFIWTGEATAPFFPLTPVEGGRS